mgnify:CR=1 FL=1
MTSNMHAINDYEHQLSRRFHCRAASLGLARRTAGTCPQTMTSDKEDVLTHLYKTLTRTGKMF